MIKTNYSLMDYRKNKYEPLRKIIAEKEAQKIIDASSYLIKNKTLVEYYYILKQNIIVLENHLDSLQNKSEDKIDVFAEINRHTSNFLNSFYQYIEFFEYNFKDNFKTIKKKYYDNHFEYRLFYHLRIHATHHSLAISELQLKFLENAIKKSAQIDLTRLEKNSRLNKDFLSEIKEKTDKKVDLKSSMIKFKTIILDLHNDMVKEISGNIISSYKCLINNMDDYDNLQGEVFLERGEKPILSLFGTLTKFLSKFSIMFIYYEEIQQNTDKYLDSYKLFLELSKLYFVEEGVCCAPKNNL
jgi:hypothetical protein